MKNRTKSVLFAVMVLSGTLMAAPAFAGQYYVLKTSKGYCKIVNKEANPSLYRTLRGDGWSQVGAGYNKKYKEAVQKMKNSSLCKKTDQNSY